MNYREALAWLYSLQRFGIKLGLENARRLFEALGVAQHRHLVIHVAGTNGKGSVCAMIDSILRAQGHTTGLFISPHLVTFRERIRCNGEMIAEESVAAGLTGIRQMVQTWEPHPTFFEITTALALRCFAQANVEVAILETGLGGRLDATNAVESDVAVITPIDLDHQQWLGDSLEKIAQEKAGIIKPHVPVVAAPQERKVEEILQQRAAECGAPLQFVPERYDQTPIALAGEHQQYNAALAIAAIQAAKIDVRQDAIERGLASVEWPARFQRWDDRIVIDGAHNPAGARILAQTWRDVFGSQRATLIFAVLDDKDILGIATALAPIGEKVILPKIRTERAIDPQVLANILSGKNPSLRTASPARTSIAPSIGDALDRARAGTAPILITGSLHFAGEALAHLQGRPAAFEECAQ